jgi:hypothetical protein
VLQLELQAEALAMDTRVGERAPAGDRYTFNFRSVEANAEGSGGAVEGGDDPFALVGEEPTVRIERELGVISERQAQLQQQLKALADHVMAQGKEHGASAPLESA